MSNPSLRYQKAAEESSAEKKKASIPLHLQAVFLIQPERPLKAVTHPDLYRSNWLFLGHVLLKRGVLHVTLHLHVAC